MSNEETNERFFLSSLSHELRTPLNGIIGYTQLLSQTRLDPIQKKYISSMNNCCMQLIELVNDILDFSKIMSGKAEINRECFTIQEIFDEVQNTIGYKIREKKQKLKFIISDNLPDFIITDRQKLLQILINLITNSNKFTSSEGRIIVSVEKIETEDKLFFKIEDNGIGISSENQKKLFQPFVQLHKEKFLGGSGLGLVITKKLIELLNGEISVESEENQGSIFSFSIKYDSHTKYNSFLSENLQLLKGRYVLIIDSDLDSRISISEMLFECGINAICASSAKEGLKLLKRFDFLAILLDLSLPEGSGEIVIVIKNELPYINIIGIGDAFISFIYNNITRPVNKLKLIDTLYRLALKENINNYKLNEIEESKGKEISILLVEDNKYNLEVLLELLKSLSYTNIKIAENGEEALDKLLSENFDIMFLDIKMPGISGIEVLQILKEKNIKQPKTAILTGSIIEEEKELCKNLGVKYFLIKPFTVVQLKNIMNRMIFGTIKN